MLRSRDVRRHGLALPDPKNPVAPSKTAHLAASLYTEYLILSDNEARVLMEAVPE